MFTSVKVSIVGTVGKNASMVGLEIVFNAF